MILKVKVVTVAGSLAVPERLLEREHEADQPKYHNFIPEGATVDKQRHKEVTAHQWEVVHVKHIKMWVATD
jgi:hypothetical protein